jgi:hypothetical protein
VLTEAFHEQRDLLKGLFFGWIHFLLWNKMNGWMDGWAKVRNISCSVLHGKQMEYGTRKIE